MWELHRFVLFAGLQSFLQQINGKADGTYEKTNKNRHATT